MLNGVNGKKQYVIEISKRVVPLENLKAQVEINNVWEKIGKNIKISAKESLDYYELRKYKPWFDERFLGLLVKGKKWP
jgi:hypothetical protein